MNFSECLYQNLLSLNLKELRKDASATSLGNKSHAFTTLFENTFARTFNLDLFKSFRQLPLLMIIVNLEESIY